MGALSGLVIENTIGFLLSGGAINATSLMARLGKFGKFAQILIDIIVGVNRAVDTVSDYVFSSLFRVIAWLLSIIKKGAKEAGVLIRQLFRKISDAAVIADDWTSPAFVDKHQLPN